MNAFTWKMRSQMSRPFLLISGVMAAMQLAHRHKNCVSEHEHGESHRRCRNARNGNRQLLFSYCQVQNLLARRPKTHTIINPNGDGFERSFAGLIPSGCVNAESTNEMTHKDSRSQCISRRSDVRPSLPSLPRENANADAASTNNMGRDQKIPKNPNR